MARIEFEGRSCERAPDESALDALLRAGINVSHSCKAGTCGSCMMRATTPEAVPAAAQAGLKDTWKASGYFLACVCYPEVDLVASVVGSDARIAATITALDRLSDNVLRLRLSTDTRFDYRPGQYLTLLRHDGLARSYSIASLPADRTLELHVRLLAAGRMSQWLACDASVGSSLFVQGPSGDCFYTAGREEQPLLLAGTGTGLAPLYGIARDALAAGHHGPIHLFHGATTSSGLYLQTELHQLAEAHPNFIYTPTVLDSDGPMDKAILKRCPTLKGWRAYICGDPAIVQRFKKALFLAGAALNDIHADAFLPSAAPAQVAPAAGVQGSGML